MRTYNSAKLIAMHKPSIHDFNFDPIAYEEQREQVFERSLSQENLSEIYSVGLSREYLHARDAEAAFNFDLNSAGEFDGVVGDRKSTRLNSSH